MDYLLHIVVMACLFSILAISLDLLAGHTGLLSLAQAAFFGIGAYTSSLLAIHFGWSFTVTLMAGAVVAAILSLFVAWPSVRLRDDYFIIATFGFQMIVFSILNNWMDLTRGPLGISGIPQPVVFGLPVNSTFRFAVLAIVLCAVTYVVVARICWSPFGRVLRAIREDEVYAKSLGKNTLVFKLAACSVSAAFAGMAGAVYAHYVSYIDPSTFTVMESILVISMVIIGGAGGKWGPLVGAVVLVILPEVLRFVGLPAQVAANLRQIIYGGLLVTLMLVRPRGLLGQFSFGRSGTTQ